MKFDQDVNACWSFFFELKVLNESKYSMPWVGCAFGNVLSWYGMIHEGKIEVSFQIRFFWTIVTPKPKKLIIVPGACNISTLNGEQELSLLLNLGYISHEAFFQIIYILVYEKHASQKYDQEKCRQ